MINRHRRTAEEINRLAAEFTGDMTSTSASGKARPLRQSLSEAVDRLTAGFAAARAKAEKQSVSWGNSSEPSVAEASKPSTPAPPPRPQETMPNSQTLKSSVYLSAIDLADWLQRSAEDDRVGSAQGLVIATKKTSSLLDHLELIRLLDSGQFNSETQEIVDVVATNDAALDQTIAATVLPGYKLGQKLIRTQKVQIYRHIGN
jgi:hypothetical protein